MKLTTFLLASSGFLVGAQAAQYTQNFDSLDYARFAPQDGWAINDPSLVLSEPLDAIDDVIFTSGTSKALHLGGDPGETTLASVSLTHSYTDTVGVLSAQFDFAIFDSLDADPDRAKFSFSFENGSGNLFSLIFTPTSQSLTPELSTTDTWAVSYQAGPAGAIVPTGFGIEESGEYFLKLSLGYGLTSADTTFNLSITGSNTLSTSGTVALNNTLSTSKIGFGFQPTAIGGAGSNLLVVDNLHVIPEPTSGLLLALSTLGLVSRRKRA